MYFKITMDKQTNRKTQIQFFWLVGFGVVLGSFIGLKFIWKKWSAIFKQTVTNIFSWHKQLPENTMLVHTSVNGEKKHKPYIFFSVYLIIFIVEKTL